MNLTFYVRNTVSKIYYIMVVKKVDVVLCLFYKTVPLFGRRPILEDGAWVGTFQMYVYKYLINFKNLRKERAWLFFNL